MNKSETKGGVKIWEFLKSLSWKIFIIFYQKEFKKKNKKLTDSQSAKSTATPPPETAAEQHFFSFSIHFTSPFASAKYFLPLLFISLILS